MYNELGLAKPVRGKGTRADSCEKGLRVCARENVGAGEW